MLMQQLARLYRSFSTRAYGSARIFSLFSTFFLCACLCLIVMHMHAVKQYSLLQVFFYCCGANECLVSFLLF